MSTIVLAPSDPRPASASTNGTTYLVTAGTLFGSAGLTFDFLMSEDVTLRIDGSLFSTDETAVLIGPGTLDAAVEVGAGGSLDGPTAIDVTGTQATVANAGTIGGADAIAVAADAAAIVDNDGTIDAAVGIRVAAGGTIVETSGILSGSVAALHRTGDGVFALLNTGDVFGTLVLSSDAGSANSVANFGRLSGAATAVLGGLGHDLVRNGGTIAGAVRLGEDSDTYVALGGGTAGLVAGGGGRDTLTGGSAGDRLDGGADDDRVSGNAGDDTLSGADGHDRIAGGDGADRVAGLAGDDTLLGEGGDDIVAGGDGADLGSGGAGADVVLGHAGDDVLIGEAGSDRVVGHGGADRLWGGDGDDTLAGGDGDDRLSGGHGDDTLHLGAGRDIVVLAPGDGCDLVTGFTPGDRVDATAFDGADSAITNTVAGVTLSFGTDSVTLLGVPFETFDRSDILV